MHHNPGFHESNGLKFAQLISLEPETEFQIPVATRFRGEFASTLRIGKIGYFGLLGEALESGRVTIPDARLENGLFSPNESHAWAVKFDNTDSCELIVPETPSANVARGIIAMATSIAGQRNIEYNNWESIPLLG
jgi:hypothetical protein